MIEGLSEPQTSALTTINVACSALSFVGSAFIVVCYLSFKELRKFSFRLIFFLSLSDMVCSLFNMLGNPGEGLLCYVQGYATQFFWVASFLWTTCIAYTLYSTVVQHKTGVVSLGALFHTYVWGTAAVMTLLPSLGNDYGPAGAWCWVQNETQVGKVLRFVTFYVPLWAAITFNAVVYFKVIQMLSNASKVAVSMGGDERRGSTSGAPEGPGVPKVSLAMSRWGYYPLILIGSWAFGTVNKIHNLIDPQHPLFWLYCLHIGTADLMGLFNSIAYGLNGTVRRTLHDTLMQYWPDMWQAWGLGQFAPAFVRVGMEEDGEEGGELACLGDSDTGT